MKRLAKLGGFSWVRPGIGLEQQEIVEREGIEPSADGFRGPRTRQSPPHVPSDAAAVGSRWLLTVRCNCGRLRSRGDRPARQRAGQLGEDGQVSVEPNPLDPTDAERKQRPLILEPSELALDGPAAPVERLPPLRLAGDQGMQAVGLDPTGARLALAGRTPPLGPTARGVGPPRRPTSRARTPAGDGRRA